MEHQRIQLLEGVFLNVVQTDRFKSNYLCLNFITPLSEQTASEKSLLINVMRRGCRKYPEQTLLCRRLEELYASEIAYNSYKHGNLHLIGFSADILDNRYAMDGMDIFSDTVGLLYDTILDPLICDGAFLPSYVESEKKNQIDQINSLINHKGRYAQKRCIDQMCKGELAAIDAGGTVENTKRITPARLFEVYEDIIKNARVEIFFVGSMPLAEVRDKLLPITSKLSPRVFCASDIEMAHTAEKVHEVVEHAQAVQGKLVLGFRTPIRGGSPDSVALRLFNELFGAAPTSKLFMNVRERLHLCYMCRSFFNAPHGLLFASAGIDNQNYSLARDEILSQLEAVQKGDFTDEELAFAVRSIENSYRGIYDNPRAVEAWFMTRMLEGNVETPEQRLLRLKVLTRDDVIRISNTLSLDTVYFLHGDVQSALAEGESDDE
ncbi:MAG: insulinase family protein [Clostridia bacterium]|nr:insulinase family protein [Clostridia bacterium]